MNRRELAFCAAYVKNRSAYQAAIDAGYSQQMAKRHSHEMLQRPHIIKQLSYMEKLLMKEVVLDAAQVINQLGAMALVQPHTFLKEDESQPGRWIEVSPDELSPMQQAAIKTIKARDIYEGAGAKRRFVRQEFKYTLHDKLAALTLLGKHFEVFNDRPPPPGLGEAFEHLPQEELSEAAAMLDGLMRRAITNERALEEAIDGEVLSDD